MALELVILHHSDCGMSRFADAAAQHTVIELDVDRDHLEIVPGPRPAVAARPSTDADARIRTSASAMSDLLAGLP